MKKYLWLTALAALGCAFEASELAEGENVAEVSEALTAGQRSTLIGTKRSQNAWLGHAAGPFQHYDNPPGGRRQYTGGVIYVGDAVNRAHTIRKGPIFNKFISSGAQNAAGYPTDDEDLTPEGTGRRVNFSNGWSILQKNGAAEAYFVEGCHRHVWSRLGWERSALGFPRSDLFQLNGVGAQGESRLVNRFDYGNLYYKAGSTGCPLVSWPVLTAPPREPPAGWARIISASLSPNQAGANLTLSGSNFTPGQWVSVYINNPQFIYLAYSTTASANGTLTVTNRHVPNVNLRTINGYVTVYAVSDDGLLAVKRTSTNGTGNPYVGNY